MKPKVVFGIITSIALATTIVLFAELVSVTEARRFDSSSYDVQKAPVVISGDNAYVAWWSNKSGINEVMFRASSDGGKTFGEKVNLSNNTNVESTRVEIGAEASNVIVTWWETNETSDVPVAKISNDNGKTFGQLLKLASNGTIGE